MPKGASWTCRHCGTHNASKSGYVRQWCRECLKSWPDAAKKV